MNAIELSMSVPPIIARCFFQEHLDHIDADIATKDYTNASKQYQRIYDKNPESFKNYSEYGISLLNTEK